VRCDAGEQESIHPLRVLISPINISDIACASQKHLQCTHAKRRIEHKHEVEREKYQISLSSTDPRAR